MAIIATFDSPTVTKEQYDAVIRDLEAQGLGAPEGRMYHVAGAGPNGWHVTDVWESEETFERFGQRLVPLLQKHGMDIQPVVFPAHNVIPG